MIMGQDSQEQSPWVLRQWGFISCVTAAPFQRLPHVNLRLSRLELHTPPWIRMVHILRLIRFHVNRSVPGCVPGCVPSHDDQPGLPTNMILMGPNPVQHEYFPHSSNIVQSRLSIQKRIENGFKDLCRRVCRMMRALWNSVRARNRRQYHH